MNTVLKFDQLENMNQLEAKTFYTVLESVLANDDGAAAKAHLAAGRPIYYCEDRYPDAMVRKWPDGRRELVNVDAAGNATLIGTL